ncbi:MAG: diadenylate cyclase [Desulfobacterales bacterium]|jgi:DNA integrity scanning protein DisA with diadenylate cyclase activity
MTSMNSQNIQNHLSDGQSFRQKLEDLKRDLGCLYNMLPCSKQCSHLSDHLQEVFELREILNQLEHGLLQSHLKSCISDSIKIPGSVVLAVSKLSAGRHGAIIVIEQKNNVDDYLQGGVIIDAVVSAPILESIFYPGNQLHDGAVLIRNRRVVKAGCLLPFAPIPSGFETLGLGTRHQAAVGLSQLSDALVIVVSEEKGWISLALKGQLYPNLGTSALLQRLVNPVGGDQA